MTEDNSELNPINRKDKEYEIAKKARYLKEKGYLYPEKSLESIEADIKNKQEKDFVDKNKVAKYNKEDYYYDEEEGNWPF